MCVSLCWKTGSTLIPHNTAVLSTSLWCILLFPVRFSLSASRWETLPVCFFFLSIFQQLCSCADDWRVQSHCCFAFFSRYQWSFGVYAIIFPYIVKEAQWQLRWVLFSWADGGSLNTQCGVHIWTQDPLVPLLAILLPNLQTNGHTPWKSCPCERSVPELKIKKPGNQMS